MKYFIKHSLLFSFVFWAQFSPLNAFNFFSDLGSSSPDKKLTIEADDGVEWIAEKKMYVANGNVKAAQGDIILSADTLEAHYDDTEKSTKISTLEAFGNVTLQSQQGTLHCEKLLYDLKKKTATAKGKHLKLVYKNFQITAKNTLTFAQDENTATFYDHVIITNGSEELYADKAIAYFSNISGKFGITHIDINGHVRIISSQGILIGDSATYNVQTQTAKMLGKVKFSKDIPQSHTANAWDKPESDIITPSGQVEGFIIPSHTNQSK